MGLCCSESMLEMLTYLYKLRRFWRKTLFVILFQIYLCYQIVIYDSINYVYVNLILLIKINFLKNTEAFKDPRLDKFPKGTLKTSPKASLWLMRVCVCVIEGKRSDDQKVEITKSQSSAGLEVSYCNRIRNLFSSHNTLRTVYKEKRA